MLVKLRAIFLSQTCRVLNTYTPHQSFASNHFSNIAQRQRSMKVAVVQFSPEIGHVQENIEKAKSICDKLEPRTVDLVCLPEMIFTGYVFSDAKSIAPYLEEPYKGPTSRFCSDLAKRLECHVAAGYPEKLSETEPRGRVLVDNDSAKGQAPQQQVGANSAVLYAPDGNPVGNYRKTNLFDTDMTWAKPGTGFGTYHLPAPLNTLAIGICMDLNAAPPFCWDLEGGPYEIADHTIHQNANILLLLNNWLHSEEESEDNIDWRTLEYWTSRLRPLWDENTNRVDGDIEKKETIVIICNRSGLENGKTFAGSSAIFSMKRGSGRPKLLHFMEKDTEGVQIWTI